MATFLASRLVRPSRSPLVGVPAQWCRDRLMAVDDSGSLVCDYPPGTPVDTALASVRHHETGDFDDLMALLALEARDGNPEAANVLSKARAAWTISPALVIIDRRGKKMVRGGRAGMARHVRWMRSVGLGASARRAIEQAAMGYVQDCERIGWTASQRQHNRYVAA